jgi:hypothetical protein
VLQLSAPIVTCSISNYPPPHHSIGQGDHDPRFSTSCTNPQIVVLCSCLCFGPPQPDHHYCGVCSKFYVSRSQIKPLPTKPPSALHLLVSLAPVLLNQQLGSPRRTALARYLLLTLQKIISSNSLSSLTFPLFTPMAYASSHSPPSSKSKPYDLVDWHP